MMKIKDVFPMVIEVQFLTPKDKFDSSIGQEMLFYRIDILQKICI
jgi:hypothetical protein